VVAEGEGINERPLEEEGYKREECIKKMREGLISSHPDLSGVTLSSEVRL
jgi:hypothetical protein